MEQTDFSQAIAKHVRRARAAAGLTRKELAVRAAVSERYLSQLEQAEANVSIGILARVAGALGVDMRVFLSGDGEAAATLHPPLARLLAQLSAAEQTGLVPVIERHIVDHRRALKGIALLGLRGAGKTTLGTAFAERHQIRFVSITREVEARAGMGLADVFNLGGQDTYRALENEVVAELVQGTERVVLETSGGIVGNSEALDAILASFKTVWLKAAPAEHLQRVTGQGDLRPMQGNPKALEHLKALLATREADYARADVMLDTTGKSVDACLVELERIAAPVFSSAR